MECGTASLQPKQEIYEPHDFSSEPFRGLSTEVIFHIFKFLQAANLHIFSQVNRHAKEKIEGYVSKKPLHCQLLANSILSDINRVGKKVLQNKEPDQSVNSGNLMILLGGARAFLHLWEEAFQICEIVEKWKLEGILEPIQREIICQMIACCEEEKCTKVIKESQTLSDYLLVTKLKRGVLDEGIEQKLQAFKDDDLKKEGTFLYAKSLVKQGKLDEAEKLIQEGKLRTTRKHFFKIFTKITLATIQQKSESEILEMVRKVKLLSLSMQMFENDRFEKTSIFISEANYHAARGSSNKAERLLIAAEQSLDQIVGTGEFKYTNEDILANCYAKQIECLIEIANVRMIMDQTQLATNTLNKAKELAKKTEDYRGRVPIVKTLAENGLWQDAETLCLEIKNAEFLCQGLRFIILERMKRGMIEEARALVSIGKEKLKEAKGLDLIDRLFALLYMAEACLTQPKEKKA